MLFFIIATADEEHDDVVWTFLRSNEDRGDYFNSFSIHTSCYVRARHLTLLLHKSSFATDVRVAAADIEYRFQYELENVRVKILKSEGKHLENDIRIIEIKKFPL